jgi:phage tail-like protein
MAESGTRNDPLTNFLFGLKIQDLSLDHADGTAFFKSVSGLKMESDVTDFQEGGVTSFMRKVIGVRKWTNIVLKQGFTGDNLLWNWRDKPYRVDGVIVAIGPDMKPVCRWHFKNGYPVKWEGPEYDASKSDLAIETIEIAHEGLKMFLADDAEQES